MNVQKRRLVRPDVNAWLRNSRVPFLYFLRCHDFIKIGYSTNPYGRISTMQTCNPYEMTIITVMEGGQEEEWEIHSRFRAHKHRAEWFRYEGDVKAAIKVIEEFSDPMEARKVLGAWWHKKYGTHAMTPRPMVRSLRAEDIDR